jgi:hypothetical protein
MMKAEYGPGDVPRPQAMCSVPITYEDIEMEMIPFFDTSKKTSTAVLISGAV